MRRRMLSFLLLLSLLFTCGFKADKIDTDYITIEKYKGLDVEILKVEQVTDETVEESVQSVLGANMAKSTIDDRNAQEGDYVIIDFTGMIDGVALEDMTGSDMPLQLGSGVTIPGFEAAIEGHGTGEKFEFDLAFPDPYEMDPDRSGVEAHWIVTIKEIYTMEKPEFTDAFVKDVLQIEGVNTAQEYRDYARDIMQRNIDFNTDNEQKQLVWKALEEQVTYKGYPEDKVQEMVDDNIAIYQSMANQQNITLDEYVEQYYGMSVSEVRLDLAENSKAKLKQQMVFEAIAEAENIVVDDAYVKENADTFAQEYGFNDKADMMSIYSEEDIRYAMLQDKVLDFVLANSKNMKGETGLNTMVGPLPLWGILGGSVLLVIIIITVLATSVGRKRKKADEKRRKLREDMANKSGESETSDKETEETDTAEEAD